MKKIKYFSDYNGQTFQLKTVWCMRNSEFEIKFPGIKGKTYDSYNVRVGQPVEGSIKELPVTRIVEYKGNPSKHVCDARCVHATGKIMRCECSCGGANHGKGG